MRMRRMTTEYLDQYNDLLRYAFQVSEKTLLDTGWESEDIRQSKYPVLEHASVIGYFDGDRLASQFAVYPLQMNVHGELYDIGFITSVATYPEYAGMGLMTKLMKRSLAEMRKKGQSLSLLYPYSIPLYRHRGWEIISDKMTYTVKDYQLPLSIEVPGHVRRVEDDDDRDLLALHNRFARSTHGCILRNELAWEEYWRWDVDDMTAAIYYDGDGVPTGYMVYMLQEEVMYIKEMITLNVEAFRGLWKFIGAHESMIESVRGDNYTNETIAFWLEDSDIKETIRPYIMGRIVDVAQFLRDYRFIHPGKACGITFDVQDPFLDWNNASFSIAFDEDGGWTTEKAPASEHVALDIGALTTLLMGYKRPAYLQRLGRIKADNATLALLGRIVPQEKAYISDYI